MSESARLRPGVRSRRLAVVLAGGGALGAYEVGVLRVLEALRVEPAIVAGVSVGAINAVTWVAHGFRSRALERIWSTLEASQLGLRWTSLLLRAVGALIATTAAAEVLLTLLSSSELSAVHLFRRRISVHADVQAVLLDAAAWLVVAAFGTLLLFFARPADRWFEQLRSRVAGRHAHRWLGRTLIALLVVHALTLVFGVPWPHRFSATAIVIGGVAWWLGRASDARDPLRDFILRVLPETRGRGLWSTEPRRRLVERLVTEGEPFRLVDGRTHLVISACDLATGKVCHFTSWGEPGETFRARIHEALGDVVPLREVGDVTRAALASSAIPMIYEPVRIHGRDYVDAGAFTNQPIHVAMADDPEAILVVLLSPSSGPEPVADEPHLGELAGRLMHLANWRELQAELRHLTPEWTRAPDPATGAPARVCVVEPDRALRGGVLGFDPAQASALMAQGEADAWRALARAGWTEEP